MLTMKQAETNTKLESIECTSQKSVKFIEGLKKMIKNLENESQQLHMKHQTLKKRCWIWSTEANVITCFLME